MSIEENEVQRDGSRNKEEAALETLEQKNEVLSVDEMKDLFQPMQGDYITSALTNSGKVHPLRLTFIYIFLSFGSVIVLSMLAGNFWPNPLTKRLELAEDYGNILNFMLIIPFGILLLSNFYRQLQGGIIAMLSERIVSFPNEGAARDFLSEMNRRINHKLIFFIAIFLSVALNAWILLNLGATWNAMREGYLIAFWFRFLVTLHFSVVFYFLGKSIATVRLLRFLLKQSTDMQPLHPDRCGGFLPIGRISGAINMFLALLTLYITILVVIDGIPLTHPGFLGIVIGFFALAGYLFFVPLFYANHAMKSQKIRMLAALNRDFQSRYVLLRSQIRENQPIPPEELQLMGAIESLHRHAKSLPSWPMDIENLSKFIAVVVGPAFIAMGKIYLYPWFEKFFT